MMNVEFTEGADDFWGFCLEELKETPSFHNTFDLISCELTRFGIRSELN